MNIVYDDKFIEQFANIWNFIALDSKQRANIFKVQLKDKIETLVYMPYKFRKSIYFNNKDIRDIIFKGYNIPYKINKEENYILILGIKKYQEKF